MKNKNLAPAEKQVAFAKAFRTYKAYLDQHNYIGAYVIAFSILEDRLIASFELFHDLAGNPCPNGHISFKRKLLRLVENDVLTSDQYKTFLTCSEDRNRKVHAAMWNLDEFDGANCNGLLKNAREMDRIARRLKSQLRNGKHHKKLLVKSKP